MKPVSFLVKTAVFAVFLMICASGTAQIQFEEKPPVPPDLPNIEHLMDLYNGNVSTGDLNGDGYADVLLNGSSASHPVTRLYPNDGDGNFQLSASNLPDISNGLTLLEDVDGDGDLDIFLSGYGSSSIITTIFINNGNFEFEEIAINPFVQLFNTSAVFTDVDGDGDPDLMVTGQYASSFSQVNTKLYLNNGSGEFTLAEEQPIANLKFGHVSAADIDGDGFPEVLLTGELSSGSLQTVLYLNDGAGEFTEIWNPPLTDLQYAKSEFADIDGDGDKDLIMTGIDYLNYVIILYTNDGEGNFTEVEDTSIGNTALAKFADINGDGSPDIVTSGWGLTVYINDGTGTFTPIDTLMGAPNEFVSFLDVDNSGNLDIIAGAHSYELETILYLNDGMNNFSPAVGQLFSSLRGGTSDFQDLDGDGDLDLILTGLRSSGLSTRIYFNDGAGNFITDPSNYYHGIYYGDLDFADVDGDGDIDFFMVGKDSQGGFGNQNEARLYINDGQGQFTHTYIPDFFWQSNYGTAVFADIDGDGDPDLFVGGRSSFSVRMFVNDGDGNFTPQAENYFSGFKYSAADFADVDLDGDMDLLISGEPAGLYDPPYTKLYLNDGSGIFTESENGSIPGVANGTVNFEDVDGDGDPDLLITGYGEDDIISKLYLNDGSGNFTESLLNAFQGVYRSAAEFADINNDGYPDLFISGRKLYQERISKLYVNDGEGLFQEVLGVYFEGVDEGSVAFGDIDNDTYNDLIITGANGEYTGYTRLYRNTTVPCTDTDLDGVCDAFDACPTDAFAVLDNCGECAGGDSGNEPCEVFIDIQIIGWFETCEARTFAIDFYDPGTDNLIASFQKELPAGNVELSFSTGLIPGVYDGYFRLNGLLTKEVSNITLNADTTNYVFLTGLINGDPTHDDQINIADLSLLISSFGTSSGEAGFEMVNDLNCSGDVNIFDLSLMLAGFGQSGDDPQY